MEEMKSANRSNLPTTEVVRGMKKKKTNMLSHLRTGLGSGEKRCLVVENSARK